MSNSDSFIDEVSEELRRDRFYHMLRRYGWIAVALVVILVGAAAWNEYRKASARTEAETFGDAVVAALELESPEARRDALTAIEADGPRRALIAMLAADGLEDPEAEARTAALLEQTAGDGALPDIYRQLAELKAVMIAQGEADPASLVERLEPLANPGAPFRLLALEQRALAEVALDRTDEALATLAEILGDGQVTRDLQQRARQLTVALGGSLEQS